MRLRLAIDVDGVLFDFVSALADLVERKTGRRPRGLCDDWDHLAAWGTPSWPTPFTWADAQAHARELAETGGWYPQAQDTLARLRRDHDVRFATSPMNVPWLAARAGWLEAHGFALDAHIHLKDKSWLAADYLIDDGVHNLVGETGVRLPCRPICIARPWNAHCPIDVPRVDFADVPALLRS